jgi:transposase InsO family protein
VIGSRPNPTAVEVAAAPATAAAAAHRELLQEWFTLAGTSSGGQRRGSAWQQPRRALEQAVRDQAVAFRHWVAERGLTRCEGAACLGLSARTLRAWEHSAAANPALTRRGRPVQRSPRLARTAVLEVLEAVGPGVGLAVLQGQFPELPRAELADLLRRYRGVWLRRHGQALHVLHWPCPGTVWAVDYAEPPLPLEEGFTQLLAVRDLASGQQLLWLPAAEATAATTVAALVWLFTVYGAPLVLKMDNGSPFVAAATQELLGQWQVPPLYSPPRLPQYNGAIEAGIGSLKARTHYQAARGGHPETWTASDLEAARAAANNLGRPWGADGPTPAQRWAERRPVTAAERSAFAATVARLEEEGRACSSGEVAAPGPTVAATAPTAAQRCATAGTAQAEASGSAEQGAERGASPVAVPAREVPTEEPLRADGSGREASRRSPERAAERRQAIGRALVAHGYLLFTRRRIPPPITRKKVSKIP